VESEDIAYLVAIIELEKVDRVLCQAANCHHSIFRRVHIVLKGQEFQLLGSSCFNRWYGHLPIENRTPQFGSTAGIPMTPENRDLLLRNTADFVAYLHALEIEQSSLQRLEPRSEDADLRLTDIHEQAPTTAKVTSPSGRDLLAYMWKIKRRNEPPPIAAATQDDALSRLVLRYWETGRFGDPWALAQIMLGRHGISHLETLAVLCRLDLVDLLPAYALERTGPH
jgi:hypothetical protein